jgi:hypothetical protein
VHQNPDATIQHVIRSTDMDRQTWFERHESPTLLVAFAIYASWIGLRAKTVRLDVGLLMRAVLGWLRGEPKHCHMVAIPTAADEDARRPTRERETVVREQTRAVNRIKSMLIRFGVRTFKVELRQASKHLEALRGPKGEPLPPITLARYGNSNIGKLVPQVGRDGESKYANGHTNVDCNYTGIPQRDVARPIGASA